jgi:hypothetical protein
MTDEHPLSRLNKAAEKWRDLAEKRRLYFEELHQSGRWKYYYAEALFYRRLGKAAELVQVWDPVLKARVAEPPLASKSAPKAPYTPPPISPSTSSPLSPIPPTISSPARPGTLPRRHVI